MNFDWLAGQGLEHLPQFLTALGIGLLMGLERERNPTARAGLRTFAMVALAGSAAAMLARSFDAPSIYAVGLGAVMLMMVGAYYGAGAPARLPGEAEAVHEADPGTTTIAAAGACYLFAGLVVSGWAQLAVILAVIATVLLYFKAELGGAARGLARRDLVSILQFAVVAFVVLPLLPDREFGPYAVLNPREIWLMVVLVSGVSLAGYVAMKVAAPEQGIGLLGVLGGLVSSTATTLAFSRHVRAGSVASEVARGVILVANLTLLARLSVLAVVVAPGVLPVLLPALGGAMLAGLATMALSHRSEGDGAELAFPPLGNPAELRAAVGFALFYGLVLVAGAWLGDRWGSAGLYALSAVSGVTDVDAITLSNLRRFDLGDLTAERVAIATLVAVASNSLFKLGIVRWVGGAALFARCLPTLAAAIAGGTVTLALAAHLR